MIAIAIEPINLEFVNGCYWPEGSPAEDDQTPVLKMKYQTENSTLFVVAYSEKQISDIVNKTGIWSPYIPLLVTRRLSTDVA